MLTVIFFAYRFTFVACFVQFDTWLLWSVAYELSIPLSIYSSLKKRTMILLVQMQLLPQQTPKTQQHTSQWAHDERKGTRCPNCAILLLYRAPLILVNKENMMQSWDIDLDVLYHYDQVVDKHLLLSLSLSNDLKLRQNQLLSPAPFPGTSTSTTASISLSTMTAGFICFHENDAFDVRG